MIIRNLTVCFIAAVVVNLSANHNYFEHTFLQKTDSTLQGIWYLQPVLASDLASGKVASLNFDLSNNSFSGTTGCNIMKGHFKRDGNGLTFNDRMVTTEMSCPGYDEGNFLKNLMRTNRYKIEKGTLILMVDNTELSRWTRKVQKFKKTDTV
ncbi:MAG TPA: META domain-containing protein, partial [Puia sp.]|nr:META domain-containing protein [Puia sp.]